MNDFNLIEQSITRTFRRTIWSRFIKALKEFSLINKNDKVLLIISSFKENILLSNLFITLLKHSDFDFKIDYILLKDDNYEKNKAYLDFLSINYIEKDEIDYSLYNVVVDNFTYDDVINNILKNMLFDGKYSSLLPKIKKDHYNIINPLYFIRDDDILKFIKHNEISYIEKNRSKEEIYIKNLIKDLLKYNEFSEMNIIKSSYNVNIDKVLAYIKENKIDFLSIYEKNNL